MLAVKELFRLCFGVDKKDTRSSTLYDIGTFIIRGVCFQIELSGNNVGWIVVEVDANFEHV